MININLFNPNLRLLFAVGITAFMTFALGHLHKKWIGRRGLVVLLAAFIVAILIELSVHYMFPTDKLPALLWLMVLPFPASIGLVVITWQNKIRWLRWLAVVSVVACFLFAALLVNSYYRFYPSLYSVFGVQGKENKGYQTTQLKYGITPGKKMAHTIESALYSKTETTRGQFNSITIPGPISGFHARRSWVYVPAIADSATKINLPVIILLPGYPGLPDNWVGKGGVQDTMDEFAQHHHGITPLVFVADDAGSILNDTECVDSPRGNLETYLTKDVPNYIKANYEVSSDPKNWAIGGLSMGGMCSAMLALRHPNIFHYFLDFGGETAPEVGPKRQTIQKLFGGSEQNWQQHLPLYLLEHNSYKGKGMGAFLVVGAGDRRPLIAGLEELYRKSKAAGLDSAYEEIGGEHTFNTWYQSYKDALPWISNWLGATDCLVSCS